MNTPLTQSVPGLPTWLAFQSVEPGIWQAIELNTIVGVKYPITTNGVIGCCLRVAGMDNFVPVAVPGETVLSILSKRPREAWHDQVVAALKKYVF